MSSNDAKGRKRKPTTIPETISSNDGRNPNEERNKARRVNTTNAPASTADSLQETTENATTAKTESTEHEDSIESIGLMIQDVSHSDNVQVNAALDALNLDLKDGQKEMLQDSSRRRLSSPRSTTKEVPQNSNEESPAI
jgi:hypothetical protein